MVLINCKECNEKISDSAKACPKCGEPSQLKKLGKTNGFLQMNKIGVVTKIAFVSILLSLYNSQLLAQTTKFECRPSEGSASCEDRKKIGSTLEGIPNSLINLGFRTCLFESGNGFLGVKTSNVTGEYLGLSYGGWHLNGLISFDGRKDLPNNLTPFVLKNRKIKIERIFRDSV